MPDLTGIPAVDVAIGLSFFYFLLSIVASSINEAIAVAFGFRAKTLESGILSLLGHPDQVQRFYRHWRIDALMKPQSKENAKGKRKPSYIPSRVFALSVLDKFVLPHKDEPDPTEPAADDVAGTPPGPNLNDNLLLHSSLPADAPELIRRADRAVRSELSDLPRPLRGLLAGALNEAGTDEVRFQRALERSFDEVMDRASGWYKRRAQLITFIVALILAAAINADTFVIGQRLWKDDALRSAVVSQAQKGLANTDSKACPPKPGTSSVDRAAQCVADIQTLNLPLGWGHWPHGGWAVVHGITHGLTDGWSTWPKWPGKILGLLITAFALTLGAPFWFDLLGKIARLRGSGPPAAAAEEKATQRRESGQPATATAVAAATEPPPPPATAPAT